MEVNQHLGCKPAITPASLHEITHPFIAIRQGAWRVEALGVKRMTGTWGNFRERATRFEKSFTAALRVSGTISAACSAAEIEKRY